MTAPGVFIREIEPQAAGQLRFDVAGLVGQTQRGPLDSPQPISSWEEFETVFGVPGGFSYLPYAVLGFFANQGRLCYVVRVAHETARKAALPPLDPDSPIRIEAIDEGSWANAVQVTIEPESSGELVLSEVADPAAGGPPLAANQLRLKSADGLAAGDRVALTFRNRQSRLVIREVRGRVLTFEPSEDLGRLFPAGSKVLGKGFKLVLDYRPLRGIPRQEVFDNLSLDPQHERYFVRVVNGENDERNYLERIAQGCSILARAADARKPGSAIPRPARLLAAPLEGGEDGPHRFSSENAPAAERGFQYYIGYDSRQGFFNPRSEGPSGLAALEGVSDVCLVAIPDLVLEAFPQAAQAPINRQAPPGAGKLDAFEAAQKEMLRHCRLLGTRFALLDPPPGSDPGGGANNIGDWAARFRLDPASHFGALYYPWIRHKPSELGGRDFLLPPSGHVAGIYSRSEIGRGVAKSPANEILRAVVDLEFCLDDAQQALLNPRGVNCLRSFPGRGLRIWGARTLSPTPMHRYVNVRRLTLAVIKAILVRLRWTVFEPNDRRLWNKIESFLRLFLRSLFQNGSLAGSTPEEAYFVQCDAETNPPESVDLGRTITRIGFAPALPAEFILVTIERTPDAVTARESGGF